MQLKELLKVCSGSINIVDARDNECYYYCEYDISLCPNELENIIKMFGEYYIDEIFSMNINNDDACLCIYITPHIIFI